MAITTKGGVGMQRSVRTIRFSFFLGVTCGFLYTAALTVGQAHAQAWPSRTIKVVVPFLAGSATDVTARLISERLAEYLGVSFVVENKPGAGGNTGTDAVAKADPDGYTLAYTASGPLAINKTMFSKLPYDPETDLEPISRTAILANVIVINAKTIPVNNIQDFIAYAKQRPGQINYSSIGNGSSQHLAAVQFELATGVTMKHVPYRGVPPIIVDLISGDVPVAFQNVPSVLAPLNSGQVKALAMTTRKRSALLPDVPTLDQEGLKNFESYAWFALVAPKGTPAAIVERLNRETVRALADPALRKRMTDIGAEPSPTSQAELKTLIADEVVKWRKVIADAKLPKID
jgi:tripartite-type tricarboxylate transporter receptor subunit TctC